MRIGFIAVTLAGWGLVSSLAAQTRPSIGPSIPGESTPRPAAPSALKTSVEFELIIGDSVGGDTRSRDWAELLQEQGATVRIRQAQFDDKIGVTETVRGTLRWVKVIGILDETGRIVVADQAFSRADSVKLKEWVDELQLYGAQGSPEGKPLWGLSEEQFKSLFAAMSEPVPMNSFGETMEVAMRQMNLPAEYAVRYHSTAITHLASITSVTPVRQRLAGLSRGTSLAIILADNGLGFRPMRTPTQEIEFVIQPLADISDPWPIGWEMDKDARRNEVAPTLFKMVPVQFNDVPVQAVLDEIANVTQVPIVVDHFQVEQKGLNLQELTLSYPSRKAAWMTVINSAAARNRMKQQLRVDEQGLPFVHIAPFVSQRRPD